MSQRSSLRAVFAHTLLTGAPTHLSQMDQSALRIEFATGADLRDWLAAAGLDTPDLLTGEWTRTGEDGCTERWMYAYPDDWHGWKVYAHAIDREGPPVLATDLRARLTRQVAQTGPDRQGAA